MLKKYATNILCIAMLLLLVPMPAAVAEDVRLVMPFSPGDRLDPAFGYVGWYMRQAGIYETLFSYDEEMKLVPELATEYELESDTEWIIHLREGVKFHDGAPFNADAVMYRGKILEMGETNEIFSYPKHPYAELLIAPKLQEDRSLQDAEMNGQNGDLPGCVFYPRCPFAEDVCIEKTPEMIEMNRDHQVLCHLV
ncbi:MAG TPA: hypothetical protein HA349_03960 [Methanotrichaceae archaeon]|nr:hypothetical protein [Methanotrichaceae archaeon]